MDSKAISSLAGQRGVRSFYTDLVADSQSVRICTGLSCYLAGARCPVCGQQACPPRLAHCGRPMEPVELAPRGRVESFSDVHIAPAELRPPYRIAYVRLEAGPRVVARLAGPLASSLDPTGALVALEVGPVGLGGTPALSARPLEDAGTGRAA